MTATSVRMFMPALVLLVVGCASAPPAEGGGPRRSASLITAEEIERAHATDLYDLVHSLRPVWIQTRGRQSIEDPAAGQVVVYLDGTRIGGAENLRQIRPADVASLQYLSATEASSRFGLGHGGGAILVRTKSGRQ